MKKTATVIIAIFAVALIILTSCSGGTTTPSSTGTTTTTSPTATPSETPQYGGTARVILASGPKILGYSLEQGPSDLYPLLCAVEKLVEYDSNHQLQPWLAQSWKIDDTAKTITVQLRPGIKFQDGSDCDADAIVWNFQQQVTNKRIGYLDQWGSIETTGKDTFVIHYTGDYNNQFANAWLWSPPIYSKQAFINAGTAADGSYDIEKSKDWARLNVCGTGPFKQESFVRDVSLTMERFDDYWGPKPYLDKIIYYFVPDPVTASLMMKSNEADLWLGVGIKDQVDLEKSGFNRIVGTPSVTCLFPNIVTPDSKWQNQDLREAVEYAIDKQGIADSLGFGYGTAAKMVVPEGYWGYDSSYAGRPYNVDKARQLLQQSGYVGATVKLLALTGRDNDFATAIKRYLDDLGLKTEIDIADPGLYYGSLYGTGWPDLIVGAVGPLGDSLQTFHMNLGDEPLTRMGGWALPASLVPESKLSRTYPDQADQVAAAGKLYMGLSQGAYIIPVYAIPSANMARAGFHCDLGTQTGFTMYWGTYWLGK